MNKEEDRAGEAKYTCNDYRSEMILVGLRMKLKNEGLSEEERRLLLEEIENLEKEMGM